MKLGLRHMQALNAFTLSACTYGAAATVMLVYITEWRVITEKIPFYNTKYPKKD